MKFIIETISGRKGIKNFANLDEYVDFMTKNSDKIKTIVESDLPYDDKPVKLTSVSTSDGWEQIDNSLISDLTKAEKGDNLLQNVGQGTKKTNDILEPRKGNNNITSNSAPKVEKSPVKDENVDNKEFKYEDSNDSEKKESNDKSAKEEKKDGGKNEPLKESTNGKNILYRLLDKCWYGNGKDAGIYAKIGKWEMGLGGYDMGYEFYYNGTPVFAISPDDELRLYQDNDDTEQRIGISGKALYNLLKKYPDLRKLKCFFNDEEMDFDENLDETKYSDGDENIEIEKAPNGKYFNNHDVKGSKSHSGPYESEEDAKQALKKHRPNAKQLDESEQLNEGTGNFWLFDNSPNLAFTDEEVEETGLSDLIESGELPEWAYWECGDRTRGGCVEIQSEIPTSEYVMLVGSFGYYEGLNIGIITNPKFKSYEEWLSSEWFDDDEQARQDYKEERANFDNAYKIAKQELKKIHQNYGGRFIDVAYRMSNGETGYSDVSDTVNLDEGLFDKGLQGVNLDEAIREYFIYCFMDIFNMVSFEKNQSYQRVVNDLIKTDKKMKPFVDKVRTWIANNTYQGELPLNTCKKFIQVMIKNGVDANIVKNAFNTFKKEELNNEFDNDIAETLRIAGVKLEEGIKDYLPRGGFIRDDGDRKMGAFFGQGTDDQLAKAKIIAKVKFANGDRMGRVTKDDLDHFEEYKAQYDEIYGSDLDETAYDENDGEIDEKTGKTKFFEDETLEEEITPSRLWKYQEHPDMDFAILSADRSERSPEENAKLFNELKKDIKDMGYWYTELKGGYVEISEDGKRVPVDGENSLIVPKMTKEEAMELGKKYDQDTVMFKDAKNKTLEYIITNERAGSIGDTDSSFETQAGKDNFSVSSGSNLDYYSRLPKSNKPDLKIGFNWKG